MQNLHLHCFLITIHVMENILKPQLEYLLLLQHFREYTHGIFDWLFYYITYFGDFIIAFLIIALAYWVIDKKCGFLMFLNLSFGLLVNQLIKCSACIYRPWILDDRIKPLTSAMKTAGGYSFPSGHTAIATSTLGSIAITLWKNKIIRYSMFLLILLVAFSRNYLGVHTPQDVAISFILGIVLLFLSPKIQKWVDDGKNRDFILYLGIIVICVLLTIYTALKSYPIDILDGKILVDPQKMKIDSYPKTALTIGFFSGWLLDRKIIKYDEKSGTIISKIITFLIGAILICAMMRESTPFISSHIPVALDVFARFITIGFFITGLYPAIIKLYRLIIKKFIKNSN